LSKGSLEISVANGDNPTIKLTGEVDFHGAEAIRQAVGVLFAENTFSVNVDVADLEFIDSSGLSALLDAAKTARERGGAIHLVSPQPQLVHVLTIAGFSPYFHIAPKNGAPHRRQHPRPQPLNLNTWQVTEFETPARTELIANVRNRVSGFAESLPFTREDLEDITLAVGEAASNALRYGCSTAEDTIAVRCCSDGHSLRVQVEDSGPCFDPDAVAPPSMEAFGEGGRGIYFMRILMDEVRFYLGPSGTTVEMVKYFSVDHP